MFSLAHCSITRLWDKETKMGIAVATYAADTLIGIAAGFATSYPEQIPFNLCFGVILAQLASGTGAVFVAGTRPKKVEAKMDEENPADEKSALLQT